MPALKYAVILRLKKSRLT